MMAAARAAPAPARTTLRSNPWKASRVAKRSANHTRGGVQRALTTRSRTTPARLPTRFSA
jgi:hypothetical protein